MGQKFGQHFLQPGRILETIKEHAQSYNTSKLVEIGPGHGILTDYLLETGKQVIAIEKDRNLAENLRSVYAGPIENGNLKIVEDDIRNWEARSYISEEETYAVIGNIPFYITGTILRNTLTRTHQPSTAIFIVQKEIAERIVQRNEKHTLLSLSVEAYGTPHYLGKIKAGNFTPPPKVDAALLEITNINRDNFSTKKEEALFFELIKTAFSHRRKQAVANLEKAGLSTIRDIFATMEIPHKTRAEDIPFSSWLKITKELRISDIP